MNKEMNYYPTQPYRSSDLTDGSPTGYLSYSLSPVIGNSATSFGKISTADSSIFLLPSLTTFPSAGNLPPRRRRSCMHEEDPMMNCSRTLETEIFCASNTADMLRSRPFESPDGSRCMVPPETEKRLTYCYSVNGCHSSAKWPIEPYASWRRTYFYNEFYVNDVNKSEVSPPADMTSTRQRLRYRQPRTKSGAHHSKTRGNLPPSRQVLDHRKQRILTTAAIAVASALLALLCTIAGLLLWCKRNKKPDVEVPSIRRTELCPSAPRRYSHRELAVATSGFSDEMKIGRGGFGPVYRGYLGDQNRHVAIKVLSPQGSSAQGAKEFESEVKVMSRLRHRNIVQLLGWCDGPSRDLLLVYEFVPNGSLDKHLYDPQRVLTWSSRYNIALGVGSAILYLHTECEQCVVHGDIKPANIMLTSAFQAKLGDFGLARLLDHGADSQTTQVVAGTIGYIDPDLVNNRRPSATSDVYSFGIVLLEIACGRRATSKVVVQANGASVHLLDWVGYMYHQNSILGAADRRLDGEFDEQQMKRVLVTGLWCAHHDQSRRPSITQAMDVLRRQDAELPEPGPAVRGREAVRSLEERAYGDFSGQDSTSPAETEYHTSEDSTYLLARE